MHYTSGLTKPLRVNDLGVTLKPHSLQHSPLYGLPKNQWANRGPNVGGAYSNAPPLGDRENSDDIWTRLSLFIQLA